MTGQMLPEWEEGSSGRSCCRKGQGPGAAGPILICPGPHKAGITEQSHGHPVIFQVWLLSVTQWLWSPRELKT